METITKEEYNLRLAAYVKECYDLEPLKPSGMAGNWSYRLIKEREFKKMLHEQGIKVID